MPLRWRASRQWAWYKEREKRAELWMSARGVVRQPREGFCGRGLEREGMEYNVGVSGSRRLAVGWILRALESRRDGLKWMGCRRGLWLLYCSHRAARGRRGGFLARVVEGEEFRGGRRESLRFCHFGAALRVTVLRRY